VSDKLELQHVSRATALVLSEARSNLITRGRRDSVGLLRCEPAPACLAAVNSDGKWGFISKNGTFIAEPIYSVVRSYSCARAAFSFSSVHRRLYQRAVADMGRSLFGDCYGFVEMKWGYLDTSGTTVIPSSFEAVREFSEDLAGVLLNGHWGFIDKYGNLVIQPRFDGVRDFHDGLAVAKIEGKCGFINKIGEFVVEPIFDDLEELSEGLALVEIGHKYGFIREAGRFAIALQFDRAESFRGSISRVWKDGNNAFIDTDGRIIFQCDEDETLGNFIDGAALVSGVSKVFASECGHDVQGCDGVCSDDPCSCEYSERLCEDCSVNYAYFINRMGKNITPSRFKAFGDFSESLGVVGQPMENYDTGEHHLFGYIDTSGQIKIRPQYYAAEPFKNGKARVYTADEEWKLINIAGDLVAEGNFDEIGNFEEGFAPINVDGKYGFIDTDRSVVIEPQFRSVHNFENGMAGVQDDANNKWGFIDKTGKVVIPCQFEEVRDFQRVMT